ncbi:cubilin-like [Strongylocentrotus purpuratus]|uniref:CUB domain-containing protein n=1 Tax=Strongylocentrotus purpuratus TaxID=7668 RepID=A0A7M7T2X3_STRPU|nr:cubilin-like [Strongylocentrotus purpuratus]
MQCDWIIRIVPGRCIGISFRDFELETNQDYVEIGSGSNVGTDLVNGGKLTGHSFHHKAIVIENNVAWIRFTSDLANARRGFSAIVRGQPHNGCGGTINISNDGYIVVAFPLFPDLGYWVNLNCIWKFTGSEGRTLSVIFKDFATEETYDTVSAGYGSSPARDGSNYVINSASGSGLPEPAGFDTPSNEAWIYFRSDSFITNRGFKVEVSDTSIRHCGGEVVGGFFTTKLVIDSPGGSTYRKFLDCLWEIEIPFGGQIRLFFPQFLTEQYRDIVIVGNGTDTEDNESIFITHSGRKKPKEVLTYAQNLWVRFMTDSDYELSGWTMVVEAIPYTNCSGHLSIPPEGSITIGSPNFPNNYNNGETCYYHIIGAPGKRILVNFLEFNTERDFQDVMNIGDGCFLESGDIIVRNHSGHGLPDPGRYFSRKNAVWMTFQTSEFSDDKGWLINFADAGTPVYDVGAPCEGFVRVAEERVIEGSVP